MSWDQDPFFDRQFLSRDIGNIGNLFYGCSCPGKNGYTRLGEIGHESGYLYALRRSLDGAIKIGRTKRDVKYRVAELGHPTGNGLVHVVYTVLVGCMVTAERTAHQWAADRRLMPCAVTGREWFRLDPREAMFLLRRFECGLEFER